MLHGFEEAFRCCLPVRDLLSHVFVLPGDVLGEDEGFAESFVGALSCFELELGLLGVPDGHVLLEGLEGGDGGVVLHGECGVVPVGLPVVGLENLGVSHILVVDGVEEGLVVTVPSRCHGDALFFAWCDRSQAKSENCSHVKI